VHESEFGTKQTSRHVRSNVAASAVWSLLGGKRTSSARCEHFRF
jgi:hypothetical protein